jgi:GH15 family glucan-1,4-alpha-glucosidase
MEPKLPAVGLAFSLGQMNGHGLRSAIEDYALIGDCLTAALVSREGSIDWLCWPAFDSDACFAALLGFEEHGCWKIAPVGEQIRISRRYQSGTLILETTFACDGGEIVLIDFMPPRDATSDVVRIVRGVRGTVRMRMELMVRFCFGLNTPWVRTLRDGTWLAIAGPDMVVLRTPVNLSGRKLATFSEFEVKAGDEIPFVLTYEASHLPLPKAINPLRALQKTEDFWAAWSDRCTYRGAHHDLVLRSIITLKALTYAPTGGIVAAPTSSLPEKLGGTRNWDYRFCWLRDATFTLLALINAGYTEEAVSWHNWLLRAVAGSPSDMQIMYGITGERRLLEWEASWLPGYEGARPVRFGNVAHAQLQLDTYGELMDAIRQARSFRLDLDEHMWAFETALLEHLERIWQMPDSGIWEQRGPPQHYVLSKVMCWVAFDRGIKSAEEFGFEAPLERWKAIRSTIREEVCAKGFDAQANSFVEAYGSQFLDASLLLLPAVGFLKATDPKIRGTVANIERHLMRGGLLLRHDPRQPRPGETLPHEGAFLACTLWLADVYVLAGQIDEAQELFNRVAAVANDVDLLAEEYDVAVKRQTGNFPQALTHIALINTAHNIHHALNPAKEPAHQRAKGTPENEGDAAGKQAAE